MKLPDVGDFDQDVSMGQPRVCRPHRSAARRRRPSVSLTRLLVRMDGGCMLYGSHGEKTRRGPSRVAMRHNCKSVAGTYFPS